MEFYVTESTPDMTPPIGGEGHNKPVAFAPRIDPGLREQIAGISEITGQTVNEVGEEALRMWVDAKLADEDVRNKAVAGIEEEERRLQQRKAAIVSVLGLTATDAEKETGANSESGDAKPNGSPNGRGNRVR
jgi:hypothetical protein